MGKSDIWKWKYTVNKIQKIMRTRKWFTLRLRRYEKLFSFLFRCFSIFYFAMNSLERLDVALSSMLEIELNQTHKKIWVWNNCSNNHEEKNWIEKPHFFCELSRVVEPVSGEFQSDSDENLIALWVFFRVWNPGQIFLEIQVQRIIEFKV